MTELLKQTLALIADNNGINNKAKLAEKVSGEFNLICDRSVYYCSGYAIRFNSSATENFTGSETRIFPFRR